MKIKAHLFFIWVIVSCLTINCIVGIPVPQDEGDEEEEIGEEIAEDGGSSSSDGGEVISSSASDAGASDASAAAAGAGAAIATPSGGLPQGLSNILESDGPGETVARSSDSAAADDAVVEEETASSDAGGASDGEAAAGAGGEESLLGTLQQGLKDNAGHVAVGGIGVAAVACVVGFSSKIISLLQNSPLSQISTISDQLKKLDPTGTLDQMNGSGGNDNAGDGGAKANDKGGGVKDKLKSKLPWSKGGGAAATGAAGNGAPGLQDFASKQDAIQNESAPSKKGPKKFLRKPEEIRSALKKTGGAAGAGAASAVGSNKLKGIAEADEVEEDLIGAKSMASNLATKAQDQVSNIENLIENPEQLKELGALVQSPQQLEQIGAIIKKPNQLEEIGKLVKKPDELKQLENIMEDPSSLRKIERSIQASDRIDEIDAVLGKAKGMLGNLEQQQEASLYAATALAPASSSLFSTPGRYTEPPQSHLRGDRTDSQYMGGRSGGDHEKSEAIRRLDHILEKYNDDGHYADPRQQTGRNRDDGLASQGFVGDNYNNGGSRGGTLTRSGENYQGLGGGDSGYGGDSRGGTLTRSSAPYDQVYYDNNNSQRFMQPEESLQDVRMPQGFESDEEKASSSLEDPQIIAESAKKQSRVPSGIPGKPTNVGTRAAMGAAAGATMIGGATMAAGRAKTGSPTTTVLGKVVPAQSAVAAARKLPPPTSRTAAQRAISGRSDGARSASPVPATASVVPSRLTRPSKASSLDRVNRGRDDEYNSSGDEFGLKASTAALRRVQFRPGQDDNSYLYQQQGL